MQCSIFNESWFFFELHSNWTRTGKVLLANKLTRFTFLVINHLIKTNVFTMQTLYCTNKQRFSFLFIPFQFVVMRLRHAEESKIENSSLLMSIKAWFLIDIHGITFIIFFLKEKSLKFSAFFGAFLDWWRVQ